MIRAMAVAALLAAPAALLAQQITDRGTGAELRALDKLNGEVTDFALANGQEASLGRMVIRLGECRYPEGNRAGDAFVWLDVVEGEREVFSGWMIASSPALNAMDHPRYDIWALRCSNS